MNKKYLYELKIN